MHSTLEGPRESPVGCWRTSKWRGLVGHRNVCIIFDAYKGWIKSQAGDVLLRHTYLQISRERGRQVYLKVQKRKESEIERRTGRGREKRRERLLFYPIADPENRVCQGVKHGCLVSSRVICICRWDARKSGFRVVDMTSPTTWNAFSSWCTTPGVWQSWFISYRTFRRPREKWRRVPFEIYFYKTVHVCLFNVSLSRRPFKFEQIVFNPFCTRNYFTRTERIFLRSSGGF